MISQVREFSTFLCMGRCKSLGSLKSFFHMHLCYLGPVSCIFHPLSSSVLTIKRGCSLVDARSHRYSSSLVPLGSGIHIWRARITNDCEILVYWYGKNYSISHLCSWQPLPAHLPADSSGHLSLTLALSFRDTLLTLIPSSKAPPHLGLKDCMAGSVVSLLPHWERKHSLLSKEIIPCPTN